MVRSLRESSVRGQDPYTKAESTIQSRARGQMLSNNLGGGEQAGGHPQGKVQKTELNQVRNQETN